MNNAVDITQECRRDEVYVDACMNNGCTALIVACEVGNINVVERLLLRGATVHVSQCQGRNPLIQASQNGYTDIAAILVQFGANINAADHKGTTNLHIASQNGHCDLVTLLIQSGAKSKYC